MLRIIVDTVTAGRHRSTHVATGCRFVRVAAPSARVACGPGWRQDTMGAGYRAGCSVDTELALAVVVDSGPGRCRVMAPDRFNGLTDTTWT
jgi:hypothetical protein